MADVSTRLRRRLAWSNALPLGGAVACLTGCAVFLATVVLLLKGDRDPGPHLVLLANYFPGYRITFVGAVIGAFWGFVYSFAATVPAALLYYRSMLGRIASEAGDEGAGIEPGTTYQQLSVLDIALSAGLLCGTALFAATAVLLLRDAPDGFRGTHLELLRDVLPGYSVTWSGCFVGFAYAAGLGGVSFAIIAQLYNRLLTRADSGTEQAWEL